VVILQRRIEKSNRDVFFDLKYFHESVPEQTILEETRRHGDRKTVAATFNPQQEIFMTKRNSDKPTATKSAKAKATDRSAAIAKSWTNKKVAAARAKKDGVKVAGETYRSTAAAFEALKLPMGRHIPFRMELKDKGRAVFKDEKKGNITFTIVKGSKPE
jgi:hypothetical protein